MKTLQQQFELCNDLMIEQDQRKVFNLYLEVYEKGIVFTIKGRRGYVQSTKSTDDLGNLISKSFRGRIKPDTSYRHIQDLLNECLGTDITFHFDYNRYSYGHTYGTFYMGTFVEGDGTLSTKLF